MGAAVVQARIRTGSGSGTAANAETGAKWNREDSLAGTTPIPIPTATGSNYSYIKSFELDVTTAGTTTINNRTIKMSGSPTSGLGLFWKTVAVASYAQATSGNQPAASGSNGPATPSGYTAMTTSAAQYDNTSVATSSTGANGDMAVCAFGVDSTFAGGPGSAISVPSIILSYDEF